jgi:hypothetical protein
MASSPHPAPDVLASEADVALLGTLEPEAEDVDLPDQGYGEAPYSSSSASAYVDDSYEPEPVESGRRATVYESLPGMPGRGVVLMAGLATAGTAVLDFALTGRLSFFFDLTFVVICLVTAMAVRGHDLFTTGVLPPLLFGATVAVVTIAAPETIIAAGNLSKTFLTGLTSHAGALAFGYGTALVTVAGRTLEHRRR